MRLFIFYKTMVSDRDILVTVVSVLAPLIYILKEEYENYKLYHFAQ